MEPTPTPPATLDAFPIVVVLPVQWGDQDAFGHVNNTVYLRWYESARIAYFERIGLSALMAAERIGPILASMTCDYRRQVTYPETVRIGARITRIGRTSLTMEHLVLPDSTRSPAAEGTSTIVVFDYKASRPHPVPDAIRAAIAEVEDRPFA